MRHCLPFIVNVLLILPATLFGGEGENLLQNPSFEETITKNQFGWPFAKWGGWKYEGDCDFRVGNIGHTGKYSLLIFGASAPKIRAVQDMELEPGRYKITAWLRGLDIGTGTWNATTEFMFDGKYMPIGKNGTFGWTQLTYVGELKEKKKAGPSFGLMAPGYFWIDDVSMVKVGNDVALTEKPNLGTEEKPIQPPGEIGAAAVRCSDCGYRNMPEWKTCYACGTPLEAKKTAVAGPAVKLITSFEETKNAFDAGTIVEEHATDGKKALRIDKSYAGMSGTQDWTGFDFLKADLFTASKEPMELYVEIRDASTKDYWTRVNYVTVVPPGQSTLIMPVKQMYVGEKSRPGRMLILNTVNRLVFNIGDTPHAPLFMDNLRLERDDSAQKVAFEGLHAFDFGTGTSPVMEGFTQITPATLYSKGRGYGLKDAKIWRAFDCLQPEPLYQDFICIEGGGLAVDVPNGKYRVFVNMDSPSGFWGEYQVYTQRSITANGQLVVNDKMDFEQFRKKYFRFWNVEDLPADNTFDKYQKAYFQETTFDVDVSTGQLSLNFSGQNWACSVSCVIIYPLSKAAEGEKFLKFVEDKRRFHFDNYFKRVLHNPAGDPLSPTDEDKKRGYVVFQRECMKDLFYNDTPFKDELAKPLAAEAFAGEYRPVTLGLIPLKDLGKVKVTASDLSGPAGSVPASAIDIGFVSYRISRVTMEGTVYTINPRLIMPTNVVDAPKDVARRFWLTIKTPADAKPGLYKGNLTVTPENGAAADVPIELTVRTGTLDPIDVPAGPWSYTISIPWQDDAAKAFNDKMAAKGLHKLREYGFTTFSGLPVLTYRGFKDGKPQIDFTVGDAQMKMAREAGFTMPVITYCPFIGLDLYFQSTGEMQKAGFKDYSEFVKAIFTEVQKHADANNWLPVYWNLGDEPLGETLTRSAENAEAYRKAFPKGPPFFTAASSYAGNDPKDPHFRLGKALHVADWNLHSEDSINLLHQIGSDWAFYNGGNRWTYGTYMYKAVKQFNLKFRLSWHWNCCAGDPYYALDCREDDFAWCNATPDGQLVPAVEFERLREGLDDYRHMLTLARLAKEKAGSAAAKAAEELIATRLSAFKLGQREHDPIFGADDWVTFRRKMAEGIEALRK
ncbi:MAG TPA: glycoside hydrolase domain-containing protein [Planctomycetota bacterium]